MKIYLISGSVKIKRSISEYLLNEIMKKFDSSAETFILKNHEFEKELPVGGNAFIFAFPLYIDGLPSNFLDILEKIEESFADANPGAKIYVIINNGFYEGKQSRFAVQIMKHWCQRASVIFAGGICVGAGPISAVSPPGTDQAVNLGAGLNILAEAVGKGEILNRVLYIEPNLTRAEYLNSANEGWTRAGKKRGLTKEDLIRKL